MFDDNDVVVVDVDDYGGKGGKNELSKQSTSKKTTNKNKEIHKGNKKKEAKTRTEKKNKQQPNKHYGIIA